MVEVKHGEQGPHYSLVSSNPRVLCDRDLESSSGSILTEDTRPSLSQDGLGYYHAFTLFSHESNLS